MPSLCRMLMLVSGPACFFLAPKLFWTIRSSDPRIDFGSSSDPCSTAGGVFLSNIEDDFDGGVAIGGDTDEDEACRLTDEKSAEDDEAGLGVPPDNDFGASRGPTH